VVSHGLLSFANEINSGLKEKIYRVGMAQAMPT